MRHLGPFYWQWLSNHPWWRHQMETFSALLAICAGNSPVYGEFPAQRPVTRGFDVFFDLRLNKRLSKQSWGWWLETLSCSLWRQSNVIWTMKWASNYIPLRLWRVITHPIFLRKTGHGNPYMMTSSNGNIFRVIGPLCREFHWSPVNSPAPQRPVTRNFDVFFHLRLNKRLNKQSWGVIMDTMASQITSVTTVYSAVYSGADQRKHQSSASLAFVRGINQWPVNSLQKWQVMWIMILFDDVIMFTMFVLGSNVPLRYFRPYADGSFCPRGGTKEIVLEHIKSLMNERSHWDNFRW